MEKKCWTANAYNHLDPSLAPQYDSEQDFGFPVAPFRRDEESSEEDNPFLPRFLLQEMIFAHSPYEGLFHNRPSLQRNLLCRSDWLRPQGTSETECMFLPVQELAAVLRCSVCEQLKAEERFSARRSLPAPVLLDEFRWQSDPMPWYGSLGKADSLRSGRTDSVHDSEPDLWQQDLDAAGDYCPRVPGPQPAVPLRPRLLLRELILAHSLSDPCCFIRGSPAHPNRLALPQRGPHTPSVPSSCSRPLSTTDGSPLTH